MLETSLELMHFLPVVYHSNLPLGEVLTIALFAIIFQGLFVLQQPSVLESPGPAEIASKSHPHIFSLGPLWYHLPQVGFPKKPIMKQKLALRRFIREYSGIQHLWKGRDESRIGQREKWRCNVVSMECLSWPCEEFWRWIDPSECPTLVYQASVLICPRKRV